MRSHLNTNSFKKALSIPLFILFLMGCSKKENSDIEKNEEQSYLPLEITRTNANGMVKLYEFEYDAENRFKTIKYYNADSIYNHISYNNKGLLTKLGTDKQPEALVLEYNQTDQVVRFSERMKGQPGPHIYTYEYGTDGSMTKYNVAYAYSPTTVISYTLNYTGSNVSSIQRGSNNDYNYQYNSNSNPFYENKQLRALACINLYLLWESPLITFNSKNEIIGKTHRVPQEDAKDYIYEYDSMKRPIKVTVKDRNNVVATPIIYTISWK